MKMSGIKGFCSLRGVKFILAVKKTNIFFKKFINMRASRTVRIEILYGMRDMLPMSLQQRHMD